MCLSVCLSVTGSDVELSMLHACVCLSVCLSVTGSDIEVSKLRKAVAEDRLKMILRPFMNRFVTTAAAS